jgi:hypothetical protein
MKPALPFAQYDKDTNHLSILHKNIPDGVSNLYHEDQVDLLSYNRGFNDSLRKLVDVTTPPTRQLSDEEIEEIYSQTQGIKMIVNSPALINLLAFARAIEAKVRGEK